MNFYIRIGVFKLWLLSFVLSYSQSNNLIDTSLIEINLIDSLRVVYFKDKETNTFYIAKSPKDKSDTRLNPVKEIVNDMSGRIKGIYSITNNEENIAEEFIFYDNGSLRAIIGYKNNKRHGKCFYFYENGIIRFVGEEKMNKKIGHWIYYHANGKKKREGDFKLFQYDDDDYEYSFEDGYWYEYDENEKLIKKTLYKEGVIIQEEKM